MTNYGDLDDAVGMVRGCLIGLVMWVGIILIVRWMW